MSIAVMTKVWDLPIPAKGKLVLLALADCANDEGLAWPSISTLARKCGCDERTIQRNLRELESMGLLRREVVPNKGNRYYITAKPTPGKMTGRQNDGAAKKTKTPGKLPPKPSVTVNNKKSARATEIPDDWKPAQFGEGTESRKVVDSWPPGKLEQQAEAFAAHHRSKGNEFKDWQQAWSTWVLNSRNFGNGRSDHNNRNGSGAGIDRRSTLARAIDEGIDWLGGSQAQVS